MIVFDFQYVWLKSGNFASAVNKIDNLWTVPIVLWCSPKTHLKDVALILIEFLNFIQCLCAKYNSVDSGGALDVQTWLL